MQPVITALFAASPFKDGKPNGMVSYRSHVWCDTRAEPTTNTLHGIITSVCVQS